MLFKLLIGGVKGIIKAAKIIIKNKITQKVLSLSSDIASPLY